MSNYHIGAMLSRMWQYGLSGLVIGFIIGMVVNSWLLRGIPRDKMISDKKIRMRYGLLNWGIALFGMVIALAIGQTNL